MPGGGDLSSREAQEGRDIVFWNLVDRVIKGSHHLILVPAVFLSFAFARRWMPLVASASPESFAGSAAFNAVQFTTGALTLMGFALFARATGPLFRRGWTVVVSFVSLVAGAVALLFFEMPDWIAACATVVAAVGFHLAFLLWLELLGCLEPGKMIVAYSGSMLINCIATLLVEKSQADFAPFLLLSFPILAIGGFVGAFTTIKSPDLPAVASPGRPERPSARLLAWVTVLSFAFGMSDALIPPVSSMIPSLTGRFVFAAIICTGMVVFNRKFTLAIVYRLTLCVMVAALAVVFFFDFNPWLSRALAASGMEGFQTLALIVCCGIASRDKTTSAYICGLVFAVQNVAMYLGVVAGGELVDGFGVDEAVLGAVSILAVTVVALFVFREGDLLESYSEKALRDVRQRHATASTLAPFAAQHGLTDKETSVFFLLAAGKTSQEVAGELYLAGSTVRVHSSRIYQKLGVHSREEFDALVKGL